MNVFTGDAEEADPLGYNVKMFGSHQGFLNMKYQPNSACLSVNHENDYETKNRCIMM